MTELRLGDGTPTFQHRSDGQSRVFIQLSENAACPIGCKYCYIPGVGETAIPVEPGKMQDVLAQLVENPNFTHGTLVSLGCDTDPFLEEITPTTLSAIEFFNSRDNPFQIATKLQLPPVIRAAISDREPTAPRVVLSTSITTIDDAARLEPGAPTPEQRAQNFHLGPDDKIDPLAIIKPYRRGTIDELPAFTDLFTQHSPAGIVVGGLIAHIKRGEKTTPPFALDARRAHLLLGEEGHEFSTRLQESLRERGIETPVWHSAAVAAIALSRGAPDMRFLPEL